ncbi:hypothetical protein [Pseudonocardia sp. C8]|uniref:hypothetical protein n=1 Tax=Pseudonocardia sp. C8 TaxID=2762759 RepID=UPI0021081326|nr:hypothetical protein [Pseudonocardia sp. C8]
MPDLLARTLEEHTPDSEGFCRECRDATGVSATWPCVTREVAERARSLNGTGAGSDTDTVAARRRARDLNGAGTGRHTSA